MKSWLSTCASIHPTPPTTITAVSLFFIWLWGLSDPSSRASDQPRAPALQA